MISIAKLSFFTEYHINKTNCVVIIYDTFKVTTAALIAGTVG